ncbi:MAG: NHL repeat-containing protein [Planctomycetota bacterium]|jgi:hypothetical protein
MANTRTFIIVLVVAAVIVAVLAVVRLDTTGEKGSGLSEAYEYDVEELGKVDPNLILYEESGEPISTGLTAARAIAVGGDGRIYVGGDKAIRMFSPGGSFVTELTLPDTPHCLAVAGDGRIYVGMEDHVEVYDGQGKRLAVWPTAGEDAVLASIAVGRNDVFVGDAGNRVVTRYDTSGEVIRHIGRKDAGRNIPGFVVPSPYLDVAIAPDGLLRVVNPGRLRIEAYTFDGDLEFSWGKFSSGIEGFIGCCNPVNFAMLPDGGFVTCEKGLVRVKIYDVDGAFVGVVAGPEQLVEGGTARICYFPEQCQSGGFDVAADTAGRVLVLDTVRNVVRIFIKK